MKPPDRLLSRSDAARYLGCTRLAIYALAKSGRLPCVVTLGGHMRFSCRDLDAVAHAVARARPSGAGRLGAA